MITFTDNVQTDKKLLSSTITKNPVNKIVAIGTKTEVPVVASRSTITTPENNEPSSNGEAVGGLAIIGGIGYGVFRLGKFGMAKIKGD